MARIFTISEVARATGVALQGELERVLQRPLASDHERRAGCRCLDVETARKAALTTDAGRDG